MKVLFATPYFFPRIGGLENYALGIARELQRRGHEVVVVTSRHDESIPLEEEIFGIRIIRLPMSFKVSNTPVGLGWRRKLHELLLAEWPDVVNAHTPVPGMADLAVRAARRLGIPTVLTYQNDVVKTGWLAGSAARAYCLAFGNRTLKLADVIIISSPYYLEVSRYLGRWRKKVVVVLPGVDQKRFNRDVSPEWLRSRHPGRSIVLFVGNLDRAHAHKGVDVLLDAMTRLPGELDALLVMVGRGDAIEDLEKQSAALGLSGRVVFTGFVSDDDLPHYYAGAHVLVLPS
ncbi:MAG: putative hexosyltransferase, glycosyltransferase family 1, partial [Acidimicrobiaceae bacterium]|nr:putative hexosyltransferase, glycosyltransferase family 1 [Acidimicrobiaceae bacterium]